MLPGSRRRRMKKGEGDMGRGVRKLRGKVKWRKQVRDIGILMVEMEF